MKKMLFAVICIFALSLNYTFAQDAKAKESVEESKRVKKAKELLSKVIENAGGLKNINQVKTLYVEGMRDVVDPARNIKEVFRLWWKAPDIYYAEFDYQKPVRNGFDGTTAWAINPYMAGSNQPAIIDKSNLKFLPEIMQILMPEIIRYEENKITVRYEDEHELKDGKDYAKIRVTYPNNSQEDYYFNPATKFLFKRQRDDINYMEQRVDLEIFYKEWLNINGVQIPKLASRVENGQTMIDYYFNKIEVNVPIDDSRFAIPIVPDSTEIKK